MLLLLSGPVLAWPSLATIAPRPFFIFVFPASIITARQFNALLGQELLLSLGSLGVLIDRAGLAPEHLSHAGNRAAGLVVVLKFTTTP